MESGGGGRLESVEHVSVGVAVGVAGGGGGGGAFKWTGLISDRTYHFYTVAEEDIWCTQYLLSSFVTRVIRFF